MDHIPTSKRGEVLLVRIMGVLLPTNAAPTSASRRSYQSVFHDELSKTDVDAFNEIFPAMKARGGRVPRRPTAAAA
jgi:hypothetical protein